MTPAGPLLLSVISSLLWLTWGFDPAPSACSALASGVLYGSFSLQDLFPTIATGCSWTLENPDPTKYSLYLKFNREEQVCTHFSPMEGEARLELCQGASPITFLHFDKNFVQLCLAAEPEAAPRLLAPDALEFRFVEVLLINNNNSSQFTCGVLCRWFKECLRLGERGARRCSLTQAGCSCQAEVPPVPRQNETLSNALPSADAPAATSSSQCCVTELHSGNANDLYASEIKYGKGLCQCISVRTHSSPCSSSPGPPPPLLCQCISVWTHSAPWSSRAGPLRCSASAS
uniref:Adhesion G protein-coupled receptor B N-terminal domain-containing protein n=1 Tax=Gopherus agassizii TaxID=38772 RepID=A0A452GHY4_9SAUR